MIKSFECQKIQRMMITLSSGMAALDAMLYAAEGNSNFARQNTPVILDLIKRVSAEAENLHIEFDGLIFNEEKL